MSRTLASPFRTELPCSVWPSLRFNGHGLVSNGLQRLGCGFDGDRNDNAAQDQAQEADEQREQTRNTFGWAKVAVSNCGRSNECPIESLKPRPTLSFSHEQPNEMITRARKTGIGDVRVIREQAGPSRNEFCSILTAIIQSGHGIAMPLNLRYAII